MTLSELEILGKQYFLTKLSNYKFYLNDLITMSRFHSYKLVRIRGDYWQDGYERCDRVGSGMQGGSEDGCIKTT